MKREGFRCYIRPTANNAGPLTYVCAPCPRGSFGKAGKCVSCFRGGYYQNEVGVSAHYDKEVCKRYPDGTFVKNGSGKSIIECTVCPDGTYKQFHAGFRGCFCLQDYARTDRFGPCSVCLEKGVNCSGKDYKSLQPGFYWNWNFPGGNLTEYDKFVENLNTEDFLFDSHTSYRGEIPRAFKCPRRESCSNDHSTAETKCSKGYKGWLCSKCDRNYYPVMSNCLPCPEKDWLFIEISLSVVTLVVFSVCLYCYYKREKRQSGNARSIIDVIMSRGKIALGFYQVVGEFFSSLHEVNWTNSLTFIGNIISLIELNILRLFIRPQCFHEKLKIDPKIEFIIGLTIPASSLSLACVSYGLMVACHKYKARYGAAPKSFNKEKLRYNLSTVVIIILFATYPPICTIIFQLYPKACEEFCLDISNNTCYTLLRSDYDIECKDLNVYHIFAYIATAGYVVAFPVVLYFLLKKQVQLHSVNTIHRNYLLINEHHEEPLERLITDSDREVLYPAWIDFLCENYKPQYWYWEIVELTRKVTQTVLITLLGWEDKLTVLITIGVSVLFLTLHARCLPMKNKFEQALQVLFSLVAILVNVLVAAMDVPEEYGGAMSVALIVLNVVVIAIIAVEVVFGIFLRLRHLRFHKIILTCWIRFATKFFKESKRRRKE
ncbi:hypothetical protein HOLleu_02311 [Holothuria leucospilota]|uniref:TRP C-terminal domain-containing protein n=1 Tax=Holothuria leucospilota TaxID=206669 RepID=A0A9Q1HGY9_HOLLE|nr:hypothetical protein HOLleu_02311 [Holothuria leucospilota]